MYPAVTEQVKRGDNDGVGESDFVSIQVGTGKHGLSRLLTRFHARYFSLCELPTTLVRARTVKYHTIIYISDVSLVDSCTQQQDICLPLQPSHTRSFHLIFASNGITVYRLTD